MSGSGTLPRQTSQANSRARYCSLIQTSPQSGALLSSRLRRWKGRSQLLQFSMSLVSGWPQTWQTAVVSVKTDELSC